MDADYCLYTIGLGSKDSPRWSIDDADLVITLGFDMVEYHPQLWNPAATNASSMRISCRRRSTSTICPRSS